MHSSPIDLPPTPSTTMVPPAIHGVAALAALAFAGSSLEDLLAVVDRPAASLTDLAALTLDISFAHQLAFQRERALSLQAQALRQCRMYRVAGGAPAALRVLAIMAPGDLMVNTPLDFITAHLDVRLDLLYVLPDHPLPAVVPDHDVAFFAVSESDAAALARLAPLAAAWPRPILNDPAGGLALARDALVRLLRGAPGVHMPEIVEIGRAALTARLLADGDAGLAFPVLVRPRGSHAGADLRRADDADELREALAKMPGDFLFLASFEAYRGADGQYRKYRIAFVGEQALLCHMAISDHWMIHYLNAGMVESALKRAEEARAMAEFDSVFVRRHAAALAAIRQRIGLDYVAIDCAEMPDGRLLVFEADVAAIVHMMDPPDLFPYKRPQMRRVFAAFDALLRGRARPAPVIAAPARSPPVTAAPPLLQ